MDKFPAENFFRNLFGIFVSTLAIFLLLKEKRQINLVKFGGREASELHRGLVIHLMLDS